MALLAGVLPGHIYIAPSTTPRRDGALRRRVGASPPTRLWTRACGLYHSPLDRPADFRVGFYDGTH
jgi:hypothetical protein